MAEQRRRRRGFPGLIRRQRVKRGLTQAQVAERVGVHINHIGYLEKGERKPSDKVAAALCQALELDPRDVLLALRPRLRDIVIGSDEGPGGVRLSKSLAALQADVDVRRRNGISDADIRALTALDRFGTVQAPDGYVRFLELMREVTSTRCEESPG